MASPKPLTGAQRRIVEHAVKAELKARREGLDTKNDFYRGYLWVLNKAQRIKVFTKAVARGNEHRKWHNRYGTREYALGVSAGLYDLSAVFSRDTRAARIHALLLDRYAKNEENRKRKEEFARVKQELEEMVRI